MLIHTSNSNKLFNLPAYINTPQFLYQDGRLEKAATLIAAFFYSLHTAGQSINASTDYLCALAGVHKRQLYSILRQLEDYKYIKRSGFTNRKTTSWVYRPDSKLIIEELDTSALDCTSVHELNTSAVDDTKLVQSSALNLCTPLHSYNKEDIKEDIIKKQKQGTVNPLVFSSTDSVKTHLLSVINKRGAFVEDEVVEQGIYYCYEKNQDRGFASVNKRINIFLKKVREGKWLIPQGYQGITSQSIREEEELYERNKQEQFAEEAKAFKNVVSVVSSKKPYISFSERLSAYRESLNAINNPRMQENAL